MPTSPELTQLLANLAELAVKNTASSISTRVQASRAKKQDGETINELADIINDLLDDRGRLIGIARALEDALVAQRITDDEIAYITDHLIPTAEKLAGLSSTEDGANEGINLMKTLVTAETLTVLQLVGFNFKAAIGEPLTLLVERMILAQVPGKATMTVAPGAQRQRSR